MQDNDTLNTAKLIEAVLAAPQARQEAILQAATETLDKPKPQSLKLLKASEVATALGLSRVTIFRMRKENRLKSVETRKGNFLFPESELKKFVLGKTE